MKDLDDWSKPIPKELADKYLNDRSLRENFLLNYNFFNEDGNKKLYRNWIFENLGKTDNAVLEDIYRLASNTEICNSSLLSRAEIILRGNYFQFTKLAILEYLFDQKRKIQKEKNFSLANITLQHTRNPIVRFQSYLNILALGGETKKPLDYIRIILKNAVYPTLYYRILNQIQEFPMLVRKDIINMIFYNLDNKSFSKEVKNEFKRRIENIMKLD